MELEGRFGKVIQRMLVDTGASTSIICTQASPTVRQSKFTFFKILQSYNGKKSKVPFASDITCRIGNMEARLPIGLQDLDGTGILGSDIMRKLGLIIDLPN